MAGHFSGDWRKLLILWTDTFWADTSDVRCPVRAAVSRGNC